MACGTLASGSLPVEQAAQQVEARLQERVRRAALVAVRKDLPPMVRDIARAYFDVHRRLDVYLKAAFKNQHIRSWMNGEHKVFVPFDLASFIVNVPAIWEFEFVEMIGTVNDANWCAGHYRWKRFNSVRPLSPDTPWNDFRIPILHKPNSRFRAGWENRNRLKALLGPKYRRLVNDARSLTRKVFLEEFHRPATPMDQRDATTVHYRSGRTVTVRLDKKRVRHIEPHVLMKLTGYTPEELWREVDFVKRNHGEHVQPNRYNPQGDLFGVVLENPKLSV